MNIWIATALATALTLGACNNAGKRNEANMAAQENALETLNEATIANTQETLNESAMNNAALGAPAATPSANDYVAAVSAGDLYEIEGARLAITKTAKPEVKDLAEMIRRDHEKSTADLRAAAKQAQPPIPVNPAMTKEQQTDVQALRTAEGAKFDQVYLDQQVAAHEKALAMVRAYAQNGDVAGLRQHASAIASPVERHLERAKALLHQMVQP